MTNNEEIEKVDWQSAKKVLIDNESWLMKNIDCWRKFDYESWCLLMRKVYDYGFWWIFIFITVVWRMNWLHQIWTFQSNSYLQDPIKRCRQEHFLCDYFQKCSPFLHNSSFHNWKGFFLRVSYVSKLDLFLKKMLLYPISFI